MQRRFRKNHSLAIWAFVGLLLPFLTVHADSISVLVQSSPLAGFQYYEGMAFWPDMRAGDLLTLVREPDNPHDTRAIRVEWRGTKLGYLPRRENRAVASEMDRGNRVSARIARLTDATNPWQRVLIEVFVRL